MEILISKIGLRNRNPLLRIQKSDTESKTHPFAIKSTAIINDSKIRPQEICIVFTSPPALLSRISQTPGPNSLRSNTIGSLPILAAPQRVFDELSEKRQNKIRQDIPPYPLIISPNHSENKAGRTKTPLPNIKTTRKAPPKQR